jgi:hypothetical protein
MIGDRSHHSADCEMYILSPCLGIFPDFRGSFPQSGLTEIKINFVDAPIWYVSPVYRLSIAMKGYTRQWNVLYTAC